MDRVKRATVGPYKLIGSDCTGIINAGIVSEEQAVQEATLYANRTGVSVTVKDADSVEIVTVSPCSETSLKS